MYVSLFGNYKTEIDKMLSDIRLKATYATLFDGQKCCPNEKDIFKTFFGLGQHSIIISTHRESLGSPGRRAPDNLNIQRL